MPFIHLPAIVAETRVVAEAFGAAGHRVFLVGGVVRDLWLDVPLAEAADIDLTTDAIPSETRAVVAPFAEALWAQGERFGTIGSRIDGRDIEITTHRSESYQPDSRKPEVAFGTEIENDLARRDFTVNAMAIELPGGELVDPFGGASDLAKGRLRTPLGAEISFTDDPLRMLRAARFSARYGLAPDDDVVRAMTDLSSRLDIVAVERVRDEFDKLLAIDDPGDAFLLLHATGVLRRVLPGMAASLDRDDQAPLRAVASVDPSDQLGRLAAVAWWEVPDHTRGELRAWSDRIRLPNAASASLSQIIVAVSTVGDALVNTAAARRWAFTAGSQRNRALALARRVDHDAAHRLTAVIDGLAAAEDLDDPGVPLDGSDIMAIIGVGPGPHVGAAIDHLRELRFAQGPLSEAVAREALKAFPGA